MLGYTSKVYRNVVREEASIRKVHQQMSAQAIIAAAAYEHLRRRQEDTVAMPRGRRTTRTLGPNSGSDQWGATLVKRLSAGGMMAESHAAAIALHAVPFGTLTAEELINSSASVADRIPIALMAKHTRNMARGVVGQGTSKRRRSTWGVAAPPMVKGMSGYFATSSSQVSPTPVEPGEPAAARRPRRSPHRRRKTLKSPPHWHGARRQDKVEMAPPSVKA